MVYTILIATPPWGAIRTVIVQQNPACIKKEKFTYKYLGNDATALVNSLQEKTTPLSENEKKILEHVTPKKGYLDFAIEALKKSKAEMTVGEIYKYIVDNQLYTFPPNVNVTGNFRNKLNAYINEQGPNACVKKVKTGVFVYSEPQN